MKRFVWLAALVAALGSPGIVRADEPTDPQAIFAASRSAWAFNSYPRYANYTVAISYHTGSANVARHYDTLEDLRRNIVFARTFSTEETADPTLPAKGVNIGVLGMTVNSPQSDDPIGPMALAITYDFGISPAGRPTLVAQLGSQITAPEQHYTVIGRSGVVARTYDVRLIEMLDGGKTYHLGLTPIKDPKRYRLREMWVSTQTYITQKILISANFSRPPFTDVAWLVTFRQIDGGPYISDERAQAPLDFGEDGMLQDVTISFGDPSSTSTLPRYGTVGINGNPDDGGTTYLMEP